MNFPSLAVSALAISTCLLVAGLLVTRWIHNQHHLDLVIAPALAPARGELISVCIPARNEARNIAACVTSILSQTYLDLEIIVVDDQSSDSTADILRGLQSRSEKLRVIRGASPPVGWVGKPYALHQAAALARGRWLCFVDADTVLAPEAISSCYTAAAHFGADLLSLITGQIASTFWERAVMPLVLSALTVGFSPRKVNDPGRRDAIANGQFIMIRRTVFDAIGGYEQIKNQIAEDKAIAEQVKWAGYRLILADGKHLARTRMYTSLAEMWEGWTKNIYIGLRDQPHLLMLGAIGLVLLVMSSLILPAWPMLGMWWFLRGGGWAASVVIAEALLLWIVILQARASTAAALGIPRWYALTTPLGAAIFAAMMLASAWKVLSGRGVTWRGRTYLDR